MQKCIISGVGLSKTSNNLHYKTVEKELGIVTGSSWNISVFGVGNERADFDSAIQDAIKNKKEANALIKLSWMEEKINGIIFTFRRLRVKGTAVTIKERPSMKK